MFYKTYHPVLRFKKSSYVLGVRSKIWAKAKFGKIMTRMTEGSKGVMIKPLKSSQIVASISTFPITYKQ
jgi:hypothetical protein